MHNNQENQSTTQKTQKVYDHYFFGFPFLLCILYFVLLKTFPWLTFSQIRLMACQQDSNFFYHLCLIWLPFFYYLDSCCKKNDFVELLSLQLHELRWADPSPITRSVITKMQITTAYFEQLNLHEVKDLLPPKHHLQAFDHSLHPGEQPDGKYFVFSLNTFWGKREETDCCLARITLHDGERCCQMAALGFIGPSDWE